MVPKANGKVRLCFYLVCLNKALIRPIHKDPRLNDILPRLTVVTYLMLIDANSRNYNLKINEKSSYLTIFSCPFGKYWYIRLPFGAAFFQKKIDELFNDTLNFFAIADDILIAGFEADGRDHDVILEQVL